MMDLTSTVQVILQEAGYYTWLTSVDRQTAICFEDDAVMGFVSTFKDSQELLKSWEATESTLLARHAVGLRRAEDKAWNVYSVFLSSASGSESETREVRRIEENLERTRKIAAGGLVSQEDIIKAMLPVLPLQYSPRLDSDDLTERLRKRIATIVPSAADAVLDDQIPATEVVRLFGRPT